VTPVVDHPGDGGDGPLDRGRRDGTRLLDPFAQPADVRPVGDGPKARAITLGDVELHGVRADVDHRVALRAIVHEPDEPLRVARVQVPRQAGLADGLEHRGLVLRFDRDRLRGLAIRDDVRHLGGAAVDLVADASLVDLDRPDRAAAAERRDELVEGVAVAVDHGPAETERVEDRSDVIGRHRERRLHDRLPALEAVGVRLA
jgi:hypothetical protein